MTHNTLVICYRRLDWWHICGALAPGNQKSQPKHLDCARWPNWCHLDWKLEHGSGRQQGSASFHRTSCKACEDLSHLWSAVRQVLTLANGDRIQMTAQMKTLFEPEHLANASPATVSRAGIIYVSNVRTLVWTTNMTFAISGGLSTICIFTQVDLGWRPVLEAWLNTHNAEEAILIRKTLDKLLEPAIDFCRWTEM